MTPPPFTAVRFQVGGRPCSLPLADVAELADIAAPTPVPGAPDAIVGLADLRGRIVTVIDLARLMGLALTPRRDAGYLALLLAPPYGHIALLVDGAVEITSAHDTQEGPDDAAEVAGAAPALPGLDAPRELSAEAIVRLSLEQVRRRFRTGSAA